MTSNTNTNTNTNIGQYPWMQSAWQRTAGAALGDINTLHHGLLISGIPGIAKREFAVALSQLLLCAEPVLAENFPRPCGQCQNCDLFCAGTHPDFHVLTTELEWRDGRIDVLAKYCDRYQDIGARDKRANPSRVIPVDQVRLLIERFYAHAHSATRKVALIVPADRMNTNAANALLKLLEEPPPNSILILVSASPAYLPATIRSRCFQIGIPLPGLDDASAWLGQHIPAADVARALNLSNGSPVDALKMYSAGFLPVQDQLLQGISELASGKTSALELAARLKQHDFLHVLDWLHRFTCDMIKEICGISQPGSRPGALNPTRLSAEKMFTVYDKVGFYRKIARDQLNEQLTLEEITLTLQYAIKG